MCLVQTEEANQMEERVREREKDRKRAEKTTEIPSAQVLSAFYVLFFSAVRCLLLSWVKLVFDAADADSASAPAVAA